MPSSYVKMRADHCPAHLTCGMTKEQMHDVADTTLPIAQDHERFVRGEADERGLTFCKATSTPPS